jgi:hypothetical protein
MLNKSKFRSQIGQTKSGFPSHLLGRHSRLDDKMIRNCMKIRINYSEILRGGIFYNISYTSRGRHESVAEHSTL